MKRIILFAGLLSIFLGAPLFAKTEACEEASASGESDAHAEYRAGWWFAVGVGSAGAAVGLAVVTGRLGLAGLGLLAYIPATLLPTRTSVVPPLEAKSPELECYQNGYLRDARQKNRRALAVGQSLVYVPAVIVGVAYYTYMMMMWVFLPHILGRGGRVRAWEKVLRRGKEQLLGKPRPQGTDLGHGWWNSPSGYVA